MKQLEMVQSVAGVQLGILRMSTSLASDRVARLMPSAHAVRALRGTAAAGTLVLTSLLSLPAQAGFNFFGIPVGGAVGDAIGTAGVAVNRLAINVGDTAAAAANRVAEGKIVDAVAMLPIDYYRGVEVIGLKAAQESDVLRAGAQIAASIVAPGVGNAAFSVWYVGRTTGDLGLALKAGAITAVTSYAQGQITGIGDMNWLAKSTTSGIVGGTATVASGGSFEEGFANAAVASVAHSIYQNYTGAPVDPRPGTKPVNKSLTVEGCVGSVDCHVILSADDMRAIDYHRMHPGTFNTDVAHAQSWKQEGSSFMQAANKVPLVNAMGYGHDILSVDAEWSHPLVLQGTIPPSYVFVWFAGGAERDKNLLDTQARPVQAQPKPQAPHVTRLASAEPGVGLFSERSQARWPK